jgi:hypothetical protein
VINSEAFDKYREAIDPYLFAEDYATVLSNIAGLYSEIEYLNPEPLIRDNDTDSTLFISSGIQYMNRFIGGGSISYPRAFLISQPVVRMNYLPSVALGSYTSFVNFGSMQMNVMYEDHQRLGDEFGDILATASSEVVDISDTTERSYLRDGLQYTTLQENFSIEGLEVADSLFHVIKLSDEQSITMSELGGGLERLLYRRSPAVMKETSGIEEVTPVNIDEVDAFRGAVLIAANNVQPSNNNQGYQLRRLLKRLPVLRTDLEVYLNALVIDKTAYMFWKRMGGVVLTSEATIEVVRNELWRNVNLAALQKAGVKSKSKMDFAVEPADFAEKYGLVG